MLFYIVGVIDGLINVDFVNFDGLSRGCFGFAIGGIIASNMVRRLADIADPFLFWFDYCVIASNCDGGGTGGRKGVASRLLYLFWLRLRVRLDSLVGIVAA